VKIFVKFGFVFCMALMVLAVGGCSSGSSDSSEVGVGSSEAAELEARIGVLEQQLASLPAGADGADGADGVDGAAGPAGPAGADGADGVDGADGADGVDGAVGPAGAGATGAAGPPGADGIDGVDGAVGPVGPAGEAMTFGVVGATGAAGAAGPLSGLTCGADEFAASFNGVWQCAVLGVTLDGIFSGDGSTHPNMMNDLISNGGYSAVGLNTNVWCYEWDCTFEVVGVADHTVCTITGAIGNSSFNTGSNGVNRTVNNIFVDWSTATGVSLNGNGAVSVQVSCGQGVIPAP
jgi:hypothetical protein